MCKGIKMSYISKEQIRDIVTKSLTITQFMFLCNKPEYIDIYAST